MGELGARVEVYRTRSKNPAQRYGWRLVAANGRKVAGSGEGYANRKHAEDMAQRVVGGTWRDVPLVDRT